VIDLDALAQAASCLDPLPMSVTRLASMVCGEEPADLQEITEIVQFDQALTASLLRAANSSWSASRTEITNVKDAVVRLGSSTVFSIALGVNVKSRMARDVPEYGLSEGDLWNHSVAASLAGELLLRKAKHKLPPETVTAALLHDVGKLVMCRFLGDDLLSVLQQAHEESGLTRMEAEYEVLGVHHAELGGLIAQIWGLPDSLVRGISYHHSPGIGMEPICYGVHLCDVIAKVIGAGLDDNTDLESYAHAMAELDLSADDFDEVCRTAETRFAEVLSRFES
jgi:HD-like signal output (HDOD) protein